MSYGLRGEFGEAFFTGTKSQVNQVKKAMIDYGILERKLHIVEPKNADYVIPPHLKEKTYIEVVNHLAEGKDYEQYRYDEAKYEAQEMTDAELLGIYEVLAYPNEEDELMIELAHSFKEYEAEKVLLEE